MEVCTEVKRQLKFRQELAKLEDDKAKEVKNLALMKAAKVWCGCFCSGVVGWCVNFVVYMVVWQKCGVV